MKTPMVHLARPVWPSRLLIICAVIGSLFIAVPHARAGTTHKLTCPPLITRGNESVAVCVWMDTGNGHIRGGGAMIASNARIHVQIDKINLGTANGVIATTLGPKNSQIGWIPEYYTKSVNEYCGPYHARMYYSIRWSDGTLWVNKHTSLTLWYSKCPL